MVDSETTNPTVTTSELPLLSQLNELRSAWEECQPKRAKGGLLSLSGFEHQFLLTLLKIVRRWKDASETERQSLNTAHAVLTEAISDITESGICVTITQVKRTLSESLIYKALEELWKIFNLASERTPSLVEHLQFVISGKFEGDRNPKEVIQGWGTQTPSKRDQPQKLQVFKTHVNYEYVSDPKTDLTVELDNLSRDEDTQTTIGRWLGYLLQLGSGLSPERASSLIWRELRHDKSLTAFRATLARLFSQSRYRFRAVRHTLGGSLSLPRTDLLSQLKASIQAKQISLILGASGSGKSALCTLGMQTKFQDNTCLFLHPSDIVDFTENSESISSRETRRLDELLAAQVIEKPVIIIDDLSDADDHSFNCVLNLLQNALTRETSDVRFVLVAHLDAGRRVRDKIAARLGAEVPIDDGVKLQQLPIDELQSSNALPGEVAELINRADQFGPALNLKLLDYLISGVQQDDIKTSSFRNDLDLLNWFWCYQVGNGYEVSQESRVLIDTALLLADNFTSDLSVYDSPVDTNTLYTLVRRDCFRVVDDRVAVTHRFVGDCARFRYLLARRRELEVSELAQRLRNPLWCQPMRWFALHLAMESAEAETWQELLQESSEGNHLQLTDLLLDGAILSKQGSNVLQGCSEKRLPFIVERIISRLLAIATFPYPAIVKSLESMSVGDRLVNQEQITGIPKAHLWEPIWRWLLSQNSEVLIEKSDSIFNAADAWLKPNGGNFTERFPLQVEVAELVLDLAQKVLLPDPDQERRYRLGDSSSTAFACIIYALKFVPERSAWLLRALAGREVTPSTRLEPTDDDIISGTGVLEPPHPRGPSARVHPKFRGFMLKHGGLYLCYVVRVNPQLCAELLLAVTISEPSYRYEFENNSDWLIGHLGTRGSSNIDVCTFKFSPLLSLLDINEPLAVDVVATLCNVATNYWHKYRWTKNRREGSQKTDTDGVTLLIGNNRKHFKGGRHALYWHRKYPWCPDIVACFLMTLEGWLYSRPTKAELERSISIIFERADTVAMLGVLVSLAKCDPNLLKSPLLPLLSSLQLFVWLEFEKIDRGQDSGLDAVKASMRLSKKEYQELLEFHQLPHRKFPLTEIALGMWLQEKIPLEATSQILADWENHQLNLIPVSSNYRAEKIRAYFDAKNWRLENDEQGNLRFRFIGILPQDPDIEAQAQSAIWNLHNFQFITECRQILDGKLSKTPELHKQLVTLLTNEEQLIDLGDCLDEKALMDTFGAMIAVILESPINDINPELENYITDYASDFSNLPISLDYLSRCQNYDMDAEAFTAHAAPKLLRRCQSESSLRASAFRCLIGVRNVNTSAFMRSWIREYGLTHPLTKELINVAPRIARLISLTYAVSYTKVIQSNTNEDGHYFLPEPEVIRDEISKRQDDKIEEIWSSLQCNFVEQKLPNTSIIDAFDWTPAILVEPFQKRPHQLQICFDWNFLVGVLIPVLEAQPEGEGEIAHDFVSLLCEQVLFALLHERELIYADPTTAQEGSQYMLYETQYQLIDKMVVSSSTEVMTLIDILLHIFKAVGLIDYIILAHVIETLSCCVVDKNYSDITDNSFINSTANKIGEYIFDIRNQQESDLRVIGNVGDVLGKLIYLLLRGNQDSVNNGTHVDQWLIDFFRRFQDALLPNRGLRRQLYRVAKLARYKQFRRVLFKTLIQHPELFPTHKNDESELLVQVLAELWDSDSTWVTNRPSQREGLKTLLGQLQEIDAVGARSLADQIADSLSNTN
jgi:archaellum biogenesis ATPase FlaH